VSHSATETGGMATIIELHKAERAARQMLDDQGLPQPDQIEYREASIALLWNDRKVAMVIDVDEPPPEASPEHGPART
jgi:uncharacterized protein with LGFP repeats